MNIPKFIGLIWVCAEQPPSICGADDEAVVKRQAHSAYDYSKRNNPLFDPEQAAWEVYQSTRTSANDPGAVVGPAQGPGARPPLKNETFYMTVGIGYSVEPHPQKLHPNSWVEIEAPNMDIARNIAFSYFGTKWCAVYAKDTFTPDDYPDGCQMRIKATVNIDFGPVGLVPDCEAPAV